MSRQRSLLFTAFFVCSGLGFLLVHYVRGLSAVEVDADADAKSRQWTSLNGKYSREATLFRFVDGKATLKQTDRKTITVAADKLSERDRRYLESRKTQIIVGKVVGLSDRASGN